MEQYTARAGETWDLIAYRLYGNEMAATDIIALNPRLADILIFEGGERLNLPEKVETTDTSTLAPWRR
jgi:phage tail protein X